jgi:hypothetical protein
MEAALAESEKYASYMGMEGKQALHLRLLTEELLGMVRAITGKFKAYFWIESQENGGYKIHLDAETPMNLDKKTGLISLSSKGVNYITGGFMGKIRDMVENGLYYYNKVDQLQIENGIYTPVGVTAGIIPESTGVDGFVWTMDEYRDKMKTARGSDPDASNAWDELERSIVASIADDVEVSVRKNDVKITISKISQ